MCHLIKKHSAHLLYLGMYQLANSSSQGRKITNIVISENFKFLIKNFGFHSTVFSTEIATLTLNVPLKLNSKDDKIGLGIAKPKEINYYILNNHECLYHLSKMTIPIATE